MTTHWNRLVGVLLALALIAAACSDDGAESSDEAAPSDSDTSDAADTTNQTEADEQAATEADDPPSQAAGGILAQVRDRGALNCGVPTAIIGFAEQDANGNWAGFDIDFCRALAAAVFGDSEAVNYVPTTSAERFTAIQTGEVDVLMRTTTRTMGREASGGQGMDYGPTTFFSGQKLAGRRSQGFTEDSTLADVIGTRVCTNAGTTTEQNISDGVAAAGGTFTLIAAGDLPAAIESFVAGQCDIFTSDQVVVFGEAATHPDNADGDWVVFPRTPISKEPLTPIYPQNDSAWGDVVDWVVFATMIADEKGITSENVAATLAELNALAAAGGEGLDAEALRLLGGEGELQTQLGLSADAFYNVLEQVGNYDEIYNRHIAPLGLPRAGSTNAQWSEGGLIYAPPAR